jgi:hypothetical protein
MVVFRAALIEESKSDQNGLLQQYAFETEIIDTGIGISKER